MAAADMYLKLDGVDGEAKDTKHTNEMEIMSFSFGVSNQGSGRDRRGIGRQQGASERSHRHEVRRQSFAGTVPELLHWQIIRNRRH